jgi:hypothetical protein
VTASYFSDARNHEYNEFQDRRIGVGQDLHRRQKKCGGAGFEDHQCGNQKTRFMSEHKENTVGWWLSQLKEPLRSRALEIGGNSLQEHCISLNEAIDHINEMGEYPDPVDADSPPKAVPAAFPTIKEVMPGVHDQPITLPEIPAVEGYTPPPASMTDSDRLSALEDRINELEGQIERLVSHYKEHTHDIRYMGQPEEFEL